MALPAPIQKFVALVKSGDKRALGVGAVVVGGGVGLFVYLRRRGQGADSGNPTDQNAAVPTDQGNGLGDSGGGGGGGGGADLSSLSDLGFGSSDTSSTGDLGLPVLSDLTTSPTDASSAGGLSAGAGPLTQGVEPFPATDFSSFQLPTLGNAGAITPTDFGNSVGSQSALPYGSDPFSMSTARNALPFDPSPPSAPAPAAPAYVQNVQALVHAPVTQTPIAPVNTALIHSPVTNQVNAALSHATVDRTAGLMHDQVVADQRVAEQQAALIHQEQQRAQAEVMQQQQLLQHQAEDAAQRIAANADAQRVAAFNNLRDALLRQQATGNYGPQLLGHTAMESQAYALSGSRAPAPIPAVAAVHYQPAPTQEARTLTPAPNVAPAVHAPAPAAPTHAPAPTSGKRT